MREAIKRVIAELGESKEHAYHQSWHNAMEYAINKLKEVLASEPVEVRGEEDDDRRKSV